jgi:hypothetical protein
MSPDARPPYAPGDRVRCLVSTGTLRMWPGPVELRRRKGIVVRVAWQGSKRFAPGYWWVTVEWALGEGYGPWPLRAEDLAPADAHWGPGGNPLDRLPP